MANFKRCTTDGDFAKVSIFAVENRRDMHPSFDTLDMVAMLCSYITEGYMLYAADANEQVVGMLGYYHGTPEKDFKDKEIVFADGSIIDRAYRGTRLFARGLRFMVEQFAQAHPEVRELRLKALSENTYTCRLYSKFTTSSYSQEGPLGGETIFCVEIVELRSTLNRIFKV
jgi:ribosomal protein S18 acetylase RimI-like enzyme